MNLEELIMDPTPELLKEPYTRDNDAVSEWKSVIQQLKALKKQGKLDYTVDDYDTPYSLHAAQIHWKFDKYGDCELRAKEVAEMLSKVTTLIIDESDHTWWQITKRLYHQA